jgi:hypothetical protein
LAISCFAILFLSAGCGKDAGNRGALSGKVTLDGQPLEQGSILLMPIEGAKGPATGGQIERGRYSLSDKAGPAVGRNRVEIRAVRKSGKMVQKPMAPQGEMVEGVEEAVAPRFNSESTLKVEIKPGNNTADFEVQSK